ncbi:MAG: archease [Robiginitalea sp.]|nr:archease [Robiginitalea sp.]
MTALLEHTSDIAIQAEGYSLKEVFSSALRQMEDVLLPEYCQGAEHYDAHLLIHLRGADPTVLLIDFLSEALALTYIQKALFCYVYFEVLNRNELLGNLYGRWYGKLENEIKAVTFHEAHLQRDPFGKWGTRVLFDL